MLARHEQEIERLQKILDSFGRGDVKPAHEYFRRKLFEAVAFFPGGEKAKNLDDVSRLLKKDQQAKLAKVEKAKNEVFEAERILINLRRAQIPENDKKAKRDLSLRIQDAMTDLALKRMDYSDAEKDLRRGYPEISKLMRFIKILDRQIEKKK
jgi:hypothetical protein